MISCPENINDFVMETAIFARVHVISKYSVFVNASL